MTYTWLWKIVAVKGAEVASVPRCLKLNKMKYRQSEGLFLRQIIAKYTSRKESSECKASLKGRLVETRWGQCGVSFNKTLFSAA